LFYYLLLLPLLLLSNFTAVFFWLPHLPTHSPPGQRIVPHPATSIPAAAKLAVKMLKMRISVIYQLGSILIPSPLLLSCICWVYYCFNQVSDDEANVFAQWKIPICLFFLAEKGKDFHTNKQIALFFFSYIK